VGRSKRTSRAAKAADWLGPEAPARERPWAYEELLLHRNGEGGEDLDALAADLLLELQELKRMQNDLYDQVVRVAELEGRIQALRLLGPERNMPEAAEVEHAMPEQPRPERRSLPSDPALPRAVKRIPSLARCEGFQVESPAGIVGYVEGLRFVSRIDEPDFLEVRGGRFGRELVLIPAEAVDEVDSELERLLVRAAPAGIQDDHPRELVSLLRRALHPAD
jgi:hypothetical protein